MNLGTDNRKKTIWAAALGLLAILAFAYEIVPMFSGPGGTPVSASQPLPTAKPQPAPRRGAGVARKVRGPASLDPTLRLDLLASSEGTVYSGSGRNIFVSQAEVKIPQAIGSAATDQAKDPRWKLPVVQPPPPIPLKFFGFANEPGEARKIFLSKGEDVFIAGEGDIVDRRYKVMRITNTSVEIQDVVNSGPPQNIPLTQG